MKELDIKDMDDIQNLFKSFVAALEGGLEAELDEELGYSKYDYRNKETDNSRNGYSKKTMKTSLGDMDIDIPRDRNGEFEPQLIKKHQTTLSGDIEEKIISMCAKGMTENDIAAHIEEIYGLDVSDSTISRVTDKILPIAKEWQSRPLEEIYAVVFMDAIDGFNRQLRKVTKNKGVFPTDDSLFKMLYPAMMDITKKWTGRRCDWGEIHSQLEIFFADRISY